ncbi:MAG: hypothetical protein ABI811_01900 [Acidobacteriota bacterium]
MFPRWICTALICTHLMAAAAFGQDLRVPPPVPPFQTSQSKKFQVDKVAAPQAVPKSKRHRKLWITIAIVAGVTVTGLVLVNKRLENEGGGIFH